MKDYEFLNILEVIFKKRLIDIKGEYGLDESFYSSFLMNCSKNQHQNNDISILEFGKILAYLEVGISLIKAKKTKGKKYLNEYDELVDKFLDDDDKIIFDKQNLERLSDFISRLSLDIKIPGN